MFYDTFIYDHIWGVGGVEYENLLQKTFAPGMERSSAARRCACLILICLIIPGKQETSVEISLNSHKKMKKSQSPPLETHRLLSHEEKTRTQSRQAYYIYSICTTICSVLLY